jgi:hypothetical protein
MFKGQVLPRTSKLVASYQQLLNDKKVPFTIKHGTYTTKIQHPNGQVNFCTTKYRNKVFIAYNKIKKDVINSDKGREIMKMKHLTTNYGSGLLPASYYSDQILNIDINQAYATCLYLNKLITKETFEYLQTLQKQERLVSVGMLARGYTQFHYVDGECVKVDTFREPTAQIFFYVIQEINYLMNDMKFFLGKDYVMYWVDGIFFRYGTPLWRIKQAEEVLLEQGYRYKYEDCKNFDYQRRGDKIVVEMIKNGELKHFEFKPESKKEILQVLYEKAKKSENQIHDGGIEGFLQKQTIVSPYD